MASSSMGVSTEPDVPPSISRRADMKPPPSGATAGVLSAVSVESDLGFDLPASQIPVYLVNATVMGAIWGMLRLASGSVLVASVSHAVWNAVNYPLFAFGAKVGKLGVTETAIYGPEVGIVGLIANAVFAAVLWRWLKSPDLRWSQDAPK